MKKIKVNWPIVITRVRRVSLPVAVAYWVVWIGAVIAAGVKWGI